MKKIIMVLITITLICSAGLATGCRARTVVIDDLTPMLKRDLLYLGQSGSNHIIVDLANDKRYAVSNAADAVLDPVPAFSEINIGATDENGKPMLSTGRQLVARAPVVTAKNSEAAASVYPAALLDSLMFRSGSEYAIQEYAVTSSKVLSDKDGKTAIEFVADLKPVVDPFQPFAGSGWGKPDAQGFVRGQRLVINLYNNDRQYCLHAPDRRLFADGAPAVSYAPPETIYRPTEPDNVWEELDAGKEAEYVLYEDGTHSFILGVRFRKRPTTFFESTIYRIDRASGERIAAFDLPRNTISVTPLALNGRTLYLNTATGGPYSEGRPGQITAIDLDTFAYTVLLTAEAAAIGAVRDTVYIVGFATDARLGGIYALDTASGIVRKVSALPGKGYDPAYEGSGLQHFSAGRLFMLWPEPIEGVPGPTYAIYAIDPVTSAIEKQP